MKKAPISAVIITKNEEDRIGRTISKLQFCQEIIVVDSNSTDGTVEIAKSFGAKVIQQEFLGYGAQKNFGFSKASFSWILSVDADEEVSKDLQEAIKNELIEQALSPSLDIDGYYVCRQNFFLGKPLKYGKESKDWLLRLFRKGAAQYDNQLVHEQMIIPEHSARLNGKLLHHTYKSWEHALDKMDKYAALGAQELKKKNKTRSRRLTYLLKPFYFLKHYILNGNFLNGLTGWRWSRLMAYYHTKKYLLLNEDI